MNTTDMELTPAELEMIRVKREQAELAKKEVDKKAQKILDEAEVRSQKILEDAKAKSAKTTGH